MSPAALPSTSPSRASIAPIWPLLFHRHSAPQISMPAQPTGPGSTSASTPIRSLSSADIAGAAVGAVAGPMLVAALLCRLSSAAHEKGNPCST
ncbi:uncharacterized protein BDW43DRAFT_282954 [Aspergillus alliaceus]|uniref:uncharacterized protein n=1 Tax=Petromyces alliaceus TaxID=209559 RepID=UPI0012A4AE09|nr:uncharacterized protein BDW43DRAFT_282954 [Aspergillus alliaceus]KAB8231169.1 hypothetical protein BDW43DRAFT_282954 [Aspergillus alliaceus]